MRAGHQQGRELPTFAATSAAVPRVAVTFHCILWYVIVVATLATLMCVCVCVCVCVTSSMISHTTGSVTTSSPSTRSVHG